MDIDIRMAFGLPADPWQFEMTTADTARVARLVAAAVDSQAMTWIAGPRGSGKTRAVRAALQKAGAPVIEPLRLDRERLHLGDIQTAIVRDLSAERPRMSGEARSGQARRILGTAQRRPVLWIDEAHCLHHSTVRGLKRLRELSWQGRTPLLGVVLSGQGEPSQLPEVALRTATARMNGLTVDEAAEALQKALGGRISRLAARRLAEAPAARTWLDLQELGDLALREADASGVPAVDEDTAAAVLAGEAAVERRPPAAAEARQSDADVARRIAAA